MNDKIKSFGVIPVVVLENAEDAKPLAEALVKGGLPVAEVTFRTAAAKECGMPLSTFRYRAEIYENAKLL